MNIRLILIAKTNDPSIKLLCQEYTKRLSHYTSFSIEILNLPKKKKFSTTRQKKEAEGLLILSNISKGDYVVLLDEKGKEFSSLGFAQFIEKKQIQSTQNMVFIIGGAYGVDQIVKGRSNSIMALSKMTFSHQMVRMIFVEQLYRAYTIIKRESYHH